ncbi:adenylate cyclase CyaB [Methanobrevibacter cuticularis]|uniref:Adenylate cyclase CyaB n=1 Tax=Methanobrevibacter cuticularis TaxID=47311 RepID=A0A166EK72_9EURY|nr:class IV adenylate cyclase [Methanobrevibacter cuticularis]KZX16748.1 adenylate cyclase CyaB [Methanobrevibacter cuticularis]
MIEVEVKAKINDFDYVINKLKVIGAKKSHIEHQEDSYFNSPLRDFAKTDEALRIRKVTIDENLSTFITYKGPKLNKSSKTREEIEVGIQDASKIASIFTNLGFVQAAIVIKDRTIYKLDEYIISLDKVEGLQPYMEIEADLDDGTDYQDTLDNIFNIFNKLGVNSGFERTSYLELLQLKK